MDRQTRGDRSALAEIYRATSAKPFEICLRLLKDEKEAEDALQDVYITLWRRADRLDASRASPISWLATFARNRAVDRLRVGKGRAASVEIDEAALVADTNPLADAMRIDAQQSACIHQCLETLDEQPRAAIRTAFFDGLTYV